MARGRSVARGDAEPLTVAGLAGDPLRAVRVAGRALKKAREHSASLRGALSDLLTFIRLLRAWSAGRYRNVPWRSLVMASAAVLYFLNPLDVIPDQLPGIGYIDDVAVITMMASMMRADLERFIDWERDADDRVG